MGRRTRRSIRGRGRREQGRGGHLPPPPDKDTPEEEGTPTGFLPPDHPGRKLERYDVPRNLWKYWGPALNT